MTRQVRYLRSNWFLRKVVNPIAMRARVATRLRVRTRTSGRTQQVPVNVLRHADGEYLVSVRGESEWVHNLRAAGECVLRRGGRTSRYTAEELPVGERAPIVDAYRGRWGYQTGPFFRRLPDPADHPVFLLRPRTMPG